MVERLLLRRKAGKGRKKLLAQPVRHALSGVLTPQSMPLQIQGKRRAAPHDVPMKRFRVSRACDQCRTERSKCDGNQPQCAPCSESARECTYTSNPKKRGLPPGYIRTIELALALVFQQNADIEASLIAKLSQESTVLLARDTKESNRLHKNWRKTKFCRELNKTLTGEQSGPGNQEALSSGEDSDAGAEQEASILYALPDVPSSLGSQQPENVRNTPHRSDVQHPVLSSTFTPLPPDCWRVLEDYSTYTQCWLPISEKLDVLKLSYSYPEQGLLLSPGMPESGRHAEMWSILALGSCQRLPSNQTNHEYSELANPKRLYTIAQSLIPTELGKFELGHVKALLNLALVNLRRSFYNAAWILVGAASRVLSTIDVSLMASSSRHAHVIASCYLLDHLLALSLERRPYLDKTDVERVGRVEEDGLEEWQPWNGELDIQRGHQSRSPTLALSSFNCLVDLVDILFKIQRNPRGRSDMLRELTDWKSALPPKFDFVRSDSTSFPTTPPAVLLQLTHFATALALSPSQAWLERILETVQTCRQQLNSARLPPILVCLLHSVNKSSINLALDRAMQVRIDRTIASLTVAPDAGSGETPRDIPTRSSDTYSRDSISRSGPPQIPHPSYPLPFGQPIVARQQQQGQHIGTRASHFEDLLPDMNPNQQPQIPQTGHFSPNAIENDFTSPALDAYDPSISGDLESFFDELASLHGAKKLQNQPQFMQNLGFAPEVSMADLLATQSGQFMPMDAPAFGTENEVEPLQFPLSDYYNAR
jgi:hypothetical protein